MSKISFSDGLNFEILVMDLCEAAKPKSCVDLEDISEDLHQRVEIAIQDYIYDSENLNIDDYNPLY